jgi:hypothetical protein
LIAIVGLLASAFALARKQSLWSNASIPKASAQPIRNSSNPPDPTIHTVTLKVARVSTDANHRLVVSMDAGGDLPGELTLMIDRNPDNTIRGGDWALVVAHAEYSGVAGDGDGDQPGMILVRRGTVWGSISAGNVVVNSDANVITLTGLQLNLTNGSLEFDGATGSGSAQATELQDTQLAQGSLVLTF